ncbi:uncharacterized protein STEHIDRAFT_108167 [Stereum hirsutum FP-91666 SS1]|uniref:uncharacterized protein n=1 Tax=Stereum hirsutum (strain FP-91666) TaxID=721885 RepID=UPI000440E9C4|nr:uncharacterized protein STEHIDRAFT_108167 [Stereum hirsutum FP-91666 SS1]EIM91667.1 hypothetical protein STEHIDRAFT_108167 [Stereum hirsutum FP-91666 SS1]
MDVKFELGAHNPGTYLNEDQRDVHVWFSEAQAGRGKGRSKAPKLFLNLFAGCYTFGTLTINDFYIIMKILNEHNFYNVNNPWQYRVSQGEDPRKEGIPDRESLTASVVHPSDTILEPGHYFLCEWDEATKEALSVSMTRVVYATPIWVRNTDVEAEGDTTLAKALLLATPEKVSNPKIVRSVALVAKIKERDLGCRVTLSVIPKRDRGGNTCGKEVVHIFPVWAQIQWERYWLRLKDKDLARWAIDEIGLERPENAMMMECNIHRQFDKYEWSFNLEKKFIRFEKSGAPTLPSELIGTKLKDVWIHSKNINDNSERSERMRENWSDLTDDQKKRRETYGDVDSRLLFHHFQTAILMHVAQGGKSRDRPALYPLKNQ